MPAEDTYACAQPQLPKPNLRHEGEEGTWPPGGRAGCGGVALPSCVPSSIFPNHFQEHWLGDKAQGINKLNAVTKSNGVTVGDWISERRHCRPALAGTAFQAHGHTKKKGQPKSELGALLECGPGEKF